MPSLQLQQYNALPAHYIRPSDINLSRLCYPGYVLDINLSRLCYPGYVLKIPLINVLIDPHQGRAWRVAPACHGGDRHS